MDWSLKGLDEVVSLIKKAHSNDFTKLQGAILLLQVRKVVKDFFLLREMKNWKFDSIHEVKDLLEKRIYRIPQQRKFQRKKVICYPCSFPGHVEAHCERKKHRLSQRNYVKRNDDSIKNRSIMKEELQTNCISRELKTFREVSC